MNVATHLDVVSSSINDTYGEGENAARTEGHSALEESLPFPIQRENSCILCRVQVFLSVCPRTLTKRYNPKYALANGNQRPKSKSVRMH